MGERTIVELVGVYHAEGSLLGEVRYVLGKLLGTAHCALCDVTHSPVRRKPEWDAMVARLGVPVTLVHLDEMPADVAAAVTAHGSPAVLARLADGGLEPLLDEAALESLHGSVPQAEAAIHAAIAERHWVLRAARHHSATDGPSASTASASPPRQE